MIRLQRFRDRTLAGLEELAGFLRYLVRRFVDDDCLNAAATLAYTTLLSLVPLFAVSFSVLTAFPVFENFNDRVQDFLFNNLVPASGEVVQSHLQDFARRAAGLTAAGMIGIMVAAVLMMGAIDKALNRIFRVTRQRRRVQSFMVYWTVITVGPFLVAFSLLLSSYLVALTEVAGVDPAGGVRQMLLNAAPVLAILAAFTFLYSAVPNRRVPLLHALAGAAFAAMLFELAKRGFAYFVTSFPSYEAIYGAMATLPIFLVWIYLSWVVVLLGAVFTQSLGTFREGRQGSLSDPRQALLLAVRLTGDFWRAQQSGRTLGKDELLRLEPEAGDLAVQEAINDLQRARVIRRTEDGQWMLARDPSTFTLLDLYRGAPFVLADVPEHLREKNAWNRQIGALLRDAMEGVEQALAKPLQTIFVAESDTTREGAAAVEADAPEVNRAPPAQQEGGNR
ncbi:MAG: virulence factor BrkB family protein [Aquisalimonadaceae bacterium]